MTTVPKKHVLALRSDKSSERAIIGGSKKRHRQVSNDSGFASQASSDDDQFFAVLDVSPESSFEFDVAMPPPVLGPIAPPKTRMGNTKVKKFDEVLSTMKREIEQLKPFTMTQATLELMIGKYQHVKESLDVLVEKDNRQTLLDIKKVFIHASLDVRFQYIDFTFMILNLVMQNTFSNISRKLFSAFFCDIMKHTEVILQTTLNLEQFNKVLDILDNGLSAFKLFCRTSVDHYHYANGIRQFVKACYAYLNAVEESVHFVTLRQTQIDTLMRLFNEITMMFKNFREIFNFTDAESTIIRLENVLSYVGKLHPWELLRRLLATIGTHLRMPEPISSSKILLRLMGFIGHEGVSDDIHPVSQTCTVTKAPLKDEPPSPKAATLGGGGFVSMEDLLIHDVRINSGVFVPWRLLTGPQIQHPTMDEFFDDEHDQSTSVSTSIPSWYVKKAKAPCHIEKGKKTKEKEMLKLRGTIAFPLSRARAPLTTWPEEAILNDEDCILFGNGLP